MDIKRIAVIGAGPSGLVALNEFLHTSKNGSSTINSYNSLENKKLPTKCAFDEIILFEQGSDIGGTWRYSEACDPPFPYNIEEYNKPYQFRQSMKISKNMWDKSGIYNHLFTNVPEGSMKFSSAQDIELSDTNVEMNPYYPFIKHEQVLEYLEKFCDVNELKKHIRFNSSVEKIYKDESTSKWAIHVLDKDGGIKIEVFDAVMVSTGRFNIPFIPKISNLKSFKGDNSSNALIHTKSFRNAKDFSGKKVLLVGSSISAIDILQYLIPACKEVYLSTNKSTVEPPKPVTDDKLVPGKWMNDILNDSNIGYVKCARIKAIINDGKSVEFEDGLIVDDFDNIIFATGYHLSFPFLDIPENDGKNYINIVSGKKNNNNYAHFKFDNIYMHTFSMTDATLAFSGIAHNTLLFLTSEANAVAASGVWSNKHTIPELTVQQQWCDLQNDNMKDGLKVIQDEQLVEFFDELYEFAPDNRVKITPLLNTEYVERSRLVLKKIFYDIANKVMEY